MAAGSALICVAYGLLAFAPPALAQSRTSTSLRYANDPFIVLTTLRFGRYETALKFDDETGTRNFDNGFVVIELFDEVTTNTFGGFTLGHVSPSPDGRPATAGINLDGFSLGIGFEGRYPVISDNVALVIAANYEYVDAGGRREDQETDYEWWSLYARAGLGLRAGRVELRGGATYRRLDGEERTRGDVNQTTNFEIDRKEAGFVELEFNVDPKGYIGLIVENGSTDQVNFYFRRFF